MLILRLRHAPAKALDTGKRFLFKFGEMCLVDLETDISVGFFVYCLSCADYADEFASGCEE